VRKIGITQRLVENQSYEEVREALDLNYCKLIYESGFLPIIFSYEIDLEQYFSLIEIDGVLLTGGNDLSVCNPNKLSTKRDIYEKKLIDYCEKNLIPVFGICRGMQILADYFGSKFKKLNNHVNTRHKLDVNSSSNFEKQLKKINDVNSFHDYGIDQISDNLIVSAKNQEGVIKAIEHKNLYFFGQMWHPERERPFDKFQKIVMSDFFNENLDQIIQIAKRASESVIKIYNKNNFSESFKSDDSPLTDADLASNKIILDELKKISNYPILSEETEIDFNTRKNWRKFWLIDPLDGTKDFIQRNGQFTINISLICDNKPILGVISIPSTGEIFYAIKNGGAFKNGKKIFNNSTRVNYVGAESNFHTSMKTASYFKNHKIKNIIKLGSSIKMCRLAEGVIDIYPRFYGSKEWDTAAAQIILYESGCKIIDIETKKELLYNKKNINNNHFIASRNDINLDT